MNNSERIFHLIAMKSRHEKGNLTPTYLSGNPYLSVREPLPICQNAKKPDFNILYIPMSYNF